MNDEALKQSQKRIICSLILIILSSANTISQNDLISFNLTKNKIRYEERFLKNVAIVKKRKLQDIQQVELQNFSSIIYTINVSIGKKQQKFNLVVDTGSSMLWIPSVECDFAFPQKYSCTIEDNCFIGQDRVEINYAKGIVVGQLGVLKMSIGNLPQIYQNFLLVDNVTDIPIDGSINGILGLGLNEDNVSKNWIQQYYKNGVIKAPSFSIYLSYQQDSILTLGGYNNQFIKDKKTINYFNVNSTQNRWMIEVENFSYGSFISGSFDSSSSSSPTSSSLLQNIGSAVLDSGFSLIGVRQNIFEKIKNSVIEELGGYYKYDQLFILCSKQNQLPNIEFQFKDQNQDKQKFEMEPQFYLDEIQNNICRIPFTSFQIEGISFILGDIFMRKYLTIYELNPLRVGIVESINTPTYSQYNTSMSIFKDLPLYSLVILAFILSLLIFILFLYTIRFLRAKFAKKLKQNPNQGEQNE